MRNFLDHKDKIIAMTILLSLLVSAGFDNIAYAFDSLPKWFGFGAN